MPILDTEDPSSAHDGGVSKYPQNQGKITLERKAEFLLSDAVDVPSYQAARKMVRQMGLDPDLISHVNVPES